MNFDNDQEYIDRTVQGDSNAFAVLVDRHKDFVFTLALRMIKNREEAEEASQDIFIKVYNSLSKFKGKSKFSTWIYRIAFNTCLDRLKKMKQKQPTVIIDEFTEQQIKSMETALDTLEKKELKNAVNKCFHLLNSQDSFLLTLYYFEDLSLIEISKIIGITPNNAKVKLFRSRKKLATILKVSLTEELICDYEKSI